MYLYFSSIKTPVGINLPVIEITDMALIVYVYVLPTSSCQIHILTACFGVPVYSRWLLIFTYFSFSYWFHGWEANYFYQETSYSLVTLKERKLGIKSFIQTSTPAIRAWELCLSRMLSPQLVISIPMFLWEGSHVRYSRCVDIQGPGV